MVRHGGDAGLAGGLEGQEPGVISTGEVAPGFWIISTSKRSATITMLSCVAIVETRSEVVDCDIVQVQDQDECREHTFEPRS